ncbi:MAG: S26 family signal peptidase [Halobellus sp.]
MDRDTAALYLVDALRTVAAVLAVGLLLVAAAGVWPPLVAIESPSMEPHVAKGDVVLVSGPERFPGDAADTRGIVTSDAAAGYRRLGAAGDCRDLPACPAPHAGYITKGDNNRAYDQVSGIAPVVKRSWVEAKAQIEIPELGRVRLAVAGEA